MRLTTLLFTSLFTATPAFAVSIDSFVAANSTTIEVTQYRGRDVIVMSLYEARALCSHLGFIGGAADFKTVPRHYQAKDIILLPVQYMGAAGDVYEKTVAEASGTDTAIHCDNNGGCDAQVLTSVSCLKVQVAK